MFFVPNYHILIKKESTVSLDKKEREQSEKQYIVCLSGTDVYREVFFSDNLEDAEFVYEYLQNKLRNSTKENDL